MTVLSILSASVYGPVWRRHVLKAMANMSSQVGKSQVSIRNYIAENMTKSGMI